MTDRKQERLDTLGNAIEFFQLLYDEVKATEQTLGEQLTEQRELTEAARALSQKMELPNQLAEDVAFWEKLHKDALLTEELQEAAPGFKRSLDEAKEKHQLALDAVSDEARLAAEQEAHRENLGSEKLKHLYHEYNTACRAVKDFEERIQGLKQELERAKLGTSEKEAAQHFLDSLSSVVQNTAQLPSEGIEGMIEAADDCDFEKLPTGMQSGFASLLPGVSQFLEKTVDNFIIWAIDDPEISDLLLDAGDSENVVEDKEIKALFHELVQGPQASLTLEEKEVWIAQQDQRITDLIDQKLQDSSITREDWEQLLLAQSKIKAMFTTFEVLDRSDENHFMSAEGLEQEVALFSEQLKRALPQNTEAKLDELETQLSTLKLFLNNPLLKMTDRARLNKAFLDVKFHFQGLYASTLHERLLALHEQVLRKAFSEEAKTDDPIEEQIAWLKTVIHQIAPVLHDTSIHQTDRVLSVKILGNLQAALQTLEAEQRKVLAAEKRAVEQAEKMEEASTLHAAVNTFYNTCNEILASDETANILAINQSLSTCEQLLDKPQLTAADSLWVFWMQYNLQSKYEALLPAHQDVLHKKIISFVHQIKECPPETLTLDEKIEWIRKKQNASADSLLKHPIPARRIDMLVLQQTQKKLRDALMPLMQEKYGPAGAARAVWLEEKTVVLEDDMQKLEAVDLNHLSGSLVEQQEQLKRYLGVTASILSNPVIKIAENAARYEGIQMQEATCMKAYQANLHAQTDVLLEEVLAGGPIDTSFENKLTWLRDRIVLVKQLGEGVVEPTPEDKEVLHALQNELEETLAAGEAWIPAEEMTSNVTLTAEQDVEPPVVSEDVVEEDLREEVKDERTLDTSVEQASDIKEALDERTDEEALSREDTPSLSVSNDRTADMLFEEVSEVAEKSSTDDDHSDTASEDVSSSDEEDLRGMPLPGPFTPERLMRSVSDIAETTTPGFTQKKESSPTAIARDISPPLSPAEEEKITPKVQSRPVKMGKYPQNVSRMETVHLWYLVQFLKEALQTPPNVTPDDENVQGMLSFIKEQSNGELTEVGVLNVIGAVREQVQDEYDKLTNFLNGIQGASGDIKALNDLLNRDLQRMERNVQDKMGVKLLKEVFEAASEPEIVQIPTVSAPAPWQPDETKLVQETVSAREMVTALQQLLLSPGELPEDEKEIQSMFTVLRFLIDEEAGKITKQSVDELIETLTHSMTQLVNHPAGIIPFSKREDNNAVLETQKQALLKLAVDFERVHEQTLSALNTFVSGDDEETSTPIL